MEIYNCVEHVISILKDKSKNDAYKFENVCELLNKQDKSNIFEILNYKMYIIFRISCLYCNTADLPIYISKNYFVPLNCKYFGGFINACANGNKKLIDYFIQHKAYNWEIKYYQPVRYLCKYPKLFWHYYQLYKFNITFDNNYVFKTICCRGSQLNLTFDKIQQHLNLAKKIYDLIKEQISDYFIIKKCLVYANLEFFKWYEEILSEKIHLNQDSNLFFRNACIQGKTNLVKYILENELYVEVYSNIYMSPILKTCCVYAQVDVLKLIFDYMDQDYLYFNFTNHFEDLSFIKGNDNQIKNLILYFYYKNDLSQEFLVNSLINAIFENDIFLSDTCYELISSDSIKYWENFIIGKIVKKNNYKKHTFEWIKKKFPSVKINSDKSIYEKFTDSIIENDFETSKSIFNEYELNITNKTLLIGPQNVNYIFNHACLNGNVECAEWILKIFLKNHTNQQGPFFLVSSDTITFICESGNVELFELVLNYCNYSDMYKYFGIACTNNKIKMVDYLYNKFNYLINLDDAFIQFVYTVSLYDAMDTYHWFSKKINIAEILNKSYKIRNLVIENMCSENNFELFTYLIKFINVDNETIKNILKWGNKFQNYNLIYYVLEFYKFHNLERNFILKNCILNRNYFILFDTYVSFFKSNEFEFDTIDICTEDAIFNNAIDAFEVLFIRLQKYNEYSIKNTYEYFEIANEKSKNNMYYLKIVFNNQNAITQYNLIKKYCQTLFINLEFLDWVISQNNNKWSLVLNYDYDFDLYKFVDIIQQYLDMDEYDKIVEFLQLKKPDTSNNESECVICQDCIGNILSNCKHVYCYNCFFNYTYKYENHNCAFCRQYLNISKCVFND